MSYLALLMLLSGLVSFACVAWLIPRAGKFGLVHAPNHRSSHTNPTPVGGGLGVVVAGSLAGLLLMLRNGDSISWAMLGLAFPLVVTGLIDDIKPLPAWIRFTLQAVLVGSFLLIVGEMPDIRLPASTTLHGAGLLFAILLVGIWWINLFNFMDGIDGIAGCQAVFMLVVAAALAVWARPDIAGDPIWMLMLCVAAATAGFLCLNWPPARIFMGDAGSTYLAFIVFAFAVVSVQSGWLNYPVWLVLGALFVTDATVTLLTRMAKGERWHLPHRSHAYQRLARWYGKKGFTHLPVTLIAIGINLLWLAPLAWACVVWRPLSWWFALLAYTPLIAAVIALGAGKTND